MLLRRLFRFHLATLLFASLVASGVLYLNLRHVREPYLNTGLGARSGGSRYVTYADGRCVRESQPSVSYYFLTRVYLENPGWPYSPWEDVNSFSIPGGGIKGERYEVTGDQWEKYKFTSTSDALGALYRDSDILSQAPQFAEKIYESPVPEVMRLENWLSMAMAKNLIIGLLIVLLPAAILEYLLRRHLRPVANPIPL